MRFWDSSAIVPLLVAESTSPAIAQEFLRDPEVVVWWGTEVECSSALTRLERDGSLGASAMGEAIARLDELSLSWHEVQSVARVRSVAIRLLRTHELRAGDALQLGAAIVAAEDAPGSLPLVTQDARLALAAAREGFSIVSV